VDSCEGGPRFLCVWDEGVIDPRITRQLLIELVDISVRNERTALRANTFGVAR